MHVALDEVLANIISYAYPDREAHEIRIGLALHDRALEARPGARKKLTL